jgi:TolB-like protein/tetratricopeptide (TPR) repeat protein
VQPACYLSAVEPERPSLIEELKRRRVIRALVGYGIGAFAVLQVIEPVMHGLHWPDAVLSYVVAALAVGFPVVVSLAWIFDVKSGRIERTEPTAGLRGPRLAVVLVGIGLLAAAPGVFWHFVVRERAPPVEPAGTEGAASIAVLPFVNLSSDTEQEYFSDGISEEILNVLARVPGLSVAARTSSFQFKGEKLDVAQIAAQLKVRMVLEGSVRKQAGKVRITAQLIDAQSGFHLWSQTYDRDLKDIFAIQDEIARAIGDELKVRVGSGDAPGSPARGTTSVQAHDLYLRGLTQWQVRRDDELWAAKDSFERAIAADPGYAEAWGGLALCQAVLPDYTTRISYEDSFARGREAAERALVLDPTMAEAYAALGSIESNELRQETGVALLRRAVALRPSFATAHQWLGTALMLIGEQEQSLASLARAAELDPRSLIVASNQASMLMIAGRNADAIAACAQTLERAPRSTLCAANTAVSYLLDGKPDQARPFYDRWARDWGGGARQVAELFEVLEGRGDRHAFARRLAATPDRSWNDPGSGNLMSNFDIPVLLVLLDEKELALRYVDAQADLASNLNLAWSLLMPALDPIRCDARFLSAVEKIKLKDVRARTVCAGR